MIYLYWYLGFGVLVLVIVYGAHLMTKTKDSESLQDILDAINPDRRKLSYRILNDMVAPFLASILVVGFWPVALYVKVKDTFKKEVVIKDREFSVEPEHLLEKFSVEEVEARESVIDPLNAVPSLPFGHLNSVWKKILNESGNSSEWWSFAAEWKTSWGHREFRAGYALVKDSKPGEFILTVLKDLPDVDLDKKASSPLSSGVANIPSWLRKNAD